MLFSEKNVKRYLGAFLKYVSFMCKVFDFHPQLTYIVFEISISEKYLNLLACNFILISLGFLKFFGNFKSKLMVDQTNIINSILK